MWSLSRFPVDNRADDVLLAIGRALYIAAQFEDKCRYVLRFANLDAAAGVDPVARLDDLIAGLPADKLLGPTLTDLGRFSSVTPDAAAVLNAAKDARNFVAHDAGLFVIHPQPGGTVTQAVAGQLVYDLGELRDHVGRLRRNVQLLARGDNLVSSWCFDISEGREEVRPHEFIGRYEAAVEHWVLEPVSDLVLDDEQF